MKNYRGLVKRFNMLVAILVLAGVSVSAFAQPVRTQTGRLLDANTGVGSGRINSLVEPSAGFSSQLYVTGQVTGLGRLGINRPYYASDELRLDLPSAQLGGFRRESVGLPDVAGGSPYVTSPYYDRSSTALGVSGLVSGLAAPGTNVPRTARQRAGAAMEMSPEFAPASEFIRAGQPGRMLAVPRLEIGNVAVREAPVDRAIPSFRPGAKAPFGLARLQDYQRLALDLHKLSRPAATLKKRPTGTLDQPLQDRLSLELGTELPQERMSEELTVAPEGQAGERLISKGRMLEGEQVDGEATLDTYSELLDQLRQQEETGDVGDAEGATVPGKLPKTYKVDAPAESLSEVNVDVGPLPNEGRVPTVEQMVELAKDQKVIVLQGLAGSGQNDFARQMATAAMKLKAGEYYNAVAAYKLAGVSTRDNPLVFLGMALARVGAGEPLSAGLNLRRAMGMLPLLAKTRLDVGNIMPRATAVARVKELDKRIAGQDRPDAILVFLSTFLHQSLQDHEQAKTGAQQLKTVAGEDKLLLEYADYVLSSQAVAGKAPASQPAQ